MTLSAGRRHDPWIGVSPVRTQPRLAGVERTTHCLGSAAPAVGVTGRGQVRFPGLETTLGGC